MSPAQLQEVAGDKWRNMSQEQRDKYKSVAKTMPATVTKNRKIFNSLGQDVAEVQAEEQRKKEKFNAMKDEIRKLVEDANDVGGEANVHVVGQKISENLFQILTTWCSISFMRFPSTVTKKMFTPLKSLLPSSVSKKESLTPFRFT
jgi:Ni,Fe-hydrogenase III component G